MGFGLDEFNVAMLVIAHKNEEQVSRLVGALKSPNTTCFVHVDCESDIDVSSLRGVVINDRMHGVLGDFSLVEIAVHLIKDAIDYGKAHGIRYSYFCLVSGQDYPLNPVSRIVEDLRLNYPKPFIDCTPWSPVNWVGAGAARCSWFGPAMKKIDATMRRGLLRKVVKLPLWIVNSVMVRFASVKLTLDKRKIGLFGGSAWWILPDDMAEHVITTLEKQEFRKRFSPVERVAVPEENWFQTVLMNSPFGSRIEVNPPEMIAQNCKTYANFSPVGKPFTGHPYVFTVEDSAELAELAEDYYLARKFDESQDPCVLDWIDENLLK